MDPSQQQTTPSSDGAQSENPNPDAAHELAVEQPGKLMRIAMMVREMLEEVRRAPLDEHARENLADIHDRVIKELKTGLSGALQEELDRITMPFADDEIPSEAELRIAQAQLLGWLEGLFQGIQAAIATQQLQMASQLEEMRRRSLPPGVGPMDPTERPEARTLDANPGQYL